MGAQNVMPKEKMLGKIVKKTSPLKIAREMRFVRWAASRKVVDLNFTVDVWPKANTSNTKLNVELTKDLAL